MTSFFACSLGGQIATGRKRLRALLLGVAIAMLAMAVVVAATGRIGPALLALGAAGLAWFSWRTGTELDLESLEIRENTLNVKLRRHEVSIPLDGLRSRRLTAEEIQHLEKLSSLGPFTAGSGGFDSHLLGEFDLYATHFESAVLIETEGLRFVLTPDDPESLLEMLARSASSDGPATIHSP